MCGLECQIHDLMTDWTLLISYDFFIAAKRGSEGSQTNWEYWRKLWRLWKLIHMQTVRHNTQKWLKVKKKKYIKGVKFIGTWFSTQFHIGIVLNRIQYGNGYCCTTLTSNEAFINQSTENTMLQKQIKSNISWSWTRNGILPQPEQDTANHYYMHLSIRSALPLTFQRLKNKLKYYTVCTPQKIFDGLLGSMPAVASLI